jgi:deoxyribodipyrimidine photolyase
MKIFLPGGADDPASDAPSKLFRLRTGERPAGYPAPIVDHSAERAEALRRYHNI